MDRNLYFAYGSNMDLARMEKRVKVVIDLGLATMPNTSLVFSTTHLTKRNDAKASYTYDDEGVLYGRLYRLLPRQMDMLDSYEGVGFSYVRTMVPVRQGEQTFPAMTYRRIDDAVVGMPDPEYLAYLFKGADQLDKDRQVECPVRKSVNDALDRSTKYIEAPVYDLEAYGELQWPIGFRL